MKSAEQEFQARVTGSVCSRIQVQQYWVEGKLRDEWNVLWMHLDDGACLRFFFDAGVFFWKEAQPSLPPDDQSYSYRLVAPSLFTSAQNKRIKNVRFSARPNSSELDLEFEGETHIVVSNADDATYVSVD